MATAYSPMTRSFIDQRTSIIDMIQGIFENRLQNEVLEHHNLITVCILNDSKHIKNSKSKESFI